MPLMIVTSGKLGGALMRTDDIAKGVELAGIRTVAEGKSAEQRLQDEQIGSRERGSYPPSPAPCQQSRPSNSCDIDTS